MRQHPEAGTVITRVNYGNARDADALVALLDHYASDPMGGGVPLANEVKTCLCNALANRLDAASFIAWAGHVPIGLINCFEGYSTFNARPLLNVHDLVVHAEHRGHGVGQSLLAAAQQLARERGCCKVTLEVLSGNALALASYARFGFKSYQLDPAAGQALLMQKWL